MPAARTDFFNDLRVDEIIEDAQDVRVLKPELTFLNRVKRVPADNRQLIGKHQGRIQIAPMVATNAKAPVFKSQKITVEANNLGKIKYGTHWSEDELEEWLDLRNSTVRDPQGIFSQGLVQKTVKDQLEGIDQQMEWLQIACQLDGQLGSASYNRFGYFLEGVTWGRYSDLKIKVATPWSSTSSTPIDDILYAAQLWSEKYGKKAGRITMGTSVFRNLINTDQFASRIRMLLAPNESYTNITKVNSPYNRGLFMKLMDMDLVLTDSRYWNQAEDGSWGQQRFLPYTPDTPVIIDDPADDMDDSVQDFGVGNPMEGRLSEMGITNPAQIIGAPKPGSAGGRAMSYAVVPADLDPVGLTIFSTAKCFPRLYQRDSNVVLYVGATTDLIPVGDFFPA